MSVGCRCFDFRAGLHRFLPGLRVSEGQCVVQRHDHPRPARAERNAGRAQAAAAAAGGLGGYFDPGIASTYLRKEFRHLTGDERVIAVSFMFCGDFDACRKQVIEAVDKAFPSDDPNWTTEVDVVAVSMGGLVARYAAVPEREGDTGRRLRVARMFTISTPHRGASLAGFPTFHRLQIDMRSDSTFLRKLEAAESADRISSCIPTCGSATSSSASRTPRRTGGRRGGCPGEALQDSHMMAMMDSRIIADVARRLRGETPLTSEPAEPLPNMPAAEPSPPAGCRRHRGKHRAPTQPVRIARWLTAA